MNTLSSVCLLGLLIATTLPRCASAEGDSPIRARLEDGAGQPVAGAKVRFGRDSFVSDEQGAFALSAPENPAGIRISIEADGLAPSVHFLLRSVEVQVVKLGVGAAIVGTLRKDGKPLAGLQIGLKISPPEQNFRTFSHLDNWRFEAVTDDQGRFRFEHLPPDTSWQMFGVMESFKRVGVMPPRTVITSGAGALLDLGELVPEPALTLAGRVVAAAGSKLPHEPAVISLGYDYFNTVQQVIADPDGTFRLEGLYAGSIRLQVVAGDLQATPWNSSRDQMNPGWLVGKLSNSHTNLVLEVGPGPYREDLNYAAVQRPAIDQPSNREIRGVEVLASDVRVSGTVVDEHTGEPLTGIEIVPGRQPPLGPRPPRPFMQKLVDVFRESITPANELPYWQTSRTRRPDAHRFEVSFESLASTPLLLVTAPGYEPMVVGPITASTNGLIVRLPRGGGPGGVVLDASGRPVAGAKVLFGASHENFGLKETGELMEWGNLAARRITDEAGRFSFPVRLHGKRLFVSHPAGWAMLEINDQRPDLKLRLEPWATVTGMLLNTNGTPAANHMLTVDFDGAWATTAQPSMLVKNHTRTGPDGRFVFTNIPPADLLLNRGTVLQTRFYASPGVTNDLGKVILDTPPPEPLLRRLKQKIGL
jgi:hypothetical protein